MLMAIERTARGQLKRPAGGASVVASAWRRSVIESSPSVARQGTAFHAAVGEKNLSGHLRILRAYAPGEYFRGFCCAAGKGIPQRDRVGHRRPRFRIVQHIGGGWR